MIKTQLFKHQSDAVSNLIKKDYWALFFDPGTGKTLTMIGFIDFHKAKNPSFRALVVCPNTLVENWEDEVIKHSSLLPITLLGSREKRLKSMKKEADVYIINYDSVPKLWRDLMNERYDCIIFDESQFVKNHRADRSTASYNLSLTIAKRFILTGTPIMNNPLDIFSQYKCLNPAIFGTNYFRFRARYAIMGGFDNKIVTKYINTGEMRQRIFACATRITKEDCLDLPEKLYSVIRFDLPEEQARVYQSLKKEFLAEYNSNIITAQVMVVRLTRFSQITAGFTKDIEDMEHSFRTNPKTEWLINFVKEQGQKVIVFCRFIKEIKMLKVALEAEGIAHTEIYGDITDRIERVKMFNETPECKVFIAEIRTGGVGINLTSAAYAVFFSNSYSYGERVQAEDRIHRIGQTKNVTYIDLLMRGTVDEGIHRTLSKKGSLAGMVIDDIVKLV